MVGKASLAAIGLIVFILGMRLMSTALRQASGPTMRRIITGMTRTRVRGAVIGASVTAIVQSSSATTVMIVGAADAGLLNLHQALSLIAGANVGTTITAQIISLRLSRLIVPLLSLGLIGQVIPRLKTVGRVTIGLGMVFGGLEWLCQGLVPLSSTPVFSHVLALTNESAVLALLAGMLLTAIVQSSSAVTGIIISLANSNTMGLPAAIAATLGSNIGTCMTAILATFGAGRGARQAACAHLLFNLGGVAMVWPILPWFIDLVAGSGPDTARQVANGHTIFNVISAICFLSLLGIIRRALEQVR